MKRNISINININNINDLIAKCATETVKSKNNKIALSRLVNTLNSKTITIDKRKLSKDYKRNLSKISDLVAQNVTIAILQGMDKAIKLDKDYFRQ